VPTFGNILFMAKPVNQAEAVMALARVKGILRPRDLAAQGIPREILRRLCESGELTRTGRGLYIVETDGITENHTLAEVARLVPRGVVCLLSALRFHELTTQSPGEIWLAIPSKARRPKASETAIRPIHFSGSALTEGVEEHIIEKVPVRIYSAAKTVADCFKARNKIGLDVAIEALRDYWRKRTGTMDELVRFAKICRVARIMQPYLESLA
jgi:predicted transcriptional regulator of viral defense system